MRFSAAISLLFAAAALAAPSHLTSRQSQQAFRISNMAANTSSILPDADLKLTLYDQVRHVETDCAIYWEYYDFYIPQSSCANTGYNISFVDGHPNDIEAFTLRFFTADESESGQWTFNKSAPNSNWICTMLAPSKYQPKETCVLGGVVFAPF